VSGSGSGRAAALVALLLTAGAPAADTVPDPGLSRAVPSDAAFVLHARMDDAMRRRMEPLWAAMGTSSFLEDLRSRLLERSDDEKHRKWLEKEAPVWIGICERVEWRKLLSREVVLAARADERRRQWIGVFRVDPLERDGIVGSIERVLYALGSISPEIELIHSRRENESVTALYKRTIDPLEDVTGVPPFILGVLDTALSEGRDISVAGKDDVVLLSTSANLLQRSLQLLDGAGSDLGFAYTARRESRLAAGKLAAPGGAGFEIHADPGALFPEVDALGALGPFVATGKLEGASLAYGFHAALAGEARGEAAALRNALAEVPPLGNVLDRIPEEATGFYAASGPRVGVLLGVVESAWKKMAPDAGELVEDERTRRELHEVSPRGFLAQLPGSWLGYAEGPPVPPGPESKWFDLGVALVIQGAAAIKDRDARIETTSSGAVIVGLKGKEGGTVGYYGYREGRVVFSKSSSKETVVAALDAKPGDSPPAIVKRLEIPTETAVEAFDTDQPPRLVQLHLAGAALEIALKKTQADPALNALIEASRKLISALEKARPPVSRARGYTVRDANAFRGQATVTFRD